VIFIATLDLKTAPSIYSKRLFVGQLTARGSVFSLAKLICQQFINLEYYKSIVGIFIDIHDSVVNFSQLYCAFRWVYFLEKLANLKAKIIVKD